MTQVQVYIKADTNDGDYITSEKRLYEKADIDTIRKVAAAIKNCEAFHNWGMGEYCRDNESPYVVYKDVLTDDEIDLFNEYVPYGEYGIHSIEQIQIREVTVLEDLF